ncbi:hypothetical protein AK830_g9492 [Neonectria ditissima]|uniref:Uncharacterized protein n=1 Tax=Neonectria ditissima TaxID=78410 RepID=A0A0P7AUM7_9HYPO|nr:hypothetical protein AK830_g9492 [Neonectria ditissima]
MTLNDSLPENSARCAEPNCNCMPLLTSSFCHVHHARTSHSGPLVNGLPRLTHFAGKPYAKRGRNPFSLPTARRSSRKPTTSLSPSKAQENAGSLKPEVEEDKLEAYVKPKLVTDLAVHKNRSISPLDHFPGINGNTNRDHKQELLGLVQAPKYDGSFREHGASSSWALPLLKTNGHAKVLNHAALNHGEEKVESSSTYPEKADFAASTLASNGNHSSQSLKQPGLENMRLQPVSHVQDSAPTQRLAVNDQVTTTITSAESSSPTKSPHEIDLQNTASSKGVSNFGTNSTFGSRSPFSDSKSDDMDDDDGRSTPEPTSEPESYGSQIFAPESDDEDQSMDLDSPIGSERRFDTDGAQSANGVNSPHGKYSPMVVPTISPSKARNEASRSKRMADFDSAAFDAVIYRQSDLKPPSGVSVGCSPITVPASSEDARLALHVNPTIHRMYNRSEEWYQKKSREIKSRGGRKAWFGKTIERQRYLRSREAAIEKERDRARKNRAIPPRREPRPRGHKQTLDFGMVPEKELPDDVQKNPAWLKACTWFRETRSRPQ